MNPSKGIPSPDFESGLEIVRLTPGTLVEEVGDTLVLLSPDRSDVVSIPSALAAYQPDPRPHLRVRQSASHLIGELEAVGLLEGQTASPLTGLTRRDTLVGSSALAGGLAFSLYLPLAAVASSLSRRPGFWATNEVTINYDLNLVDRSFPIKLYLSVLKTEYPEIQEGTFLGTWQVTVDGQTGGTEDDETAYYVWLVELPAGSPLHTTVADFEDGLIAAPDIPGTISDGIRDIHVLFTYDQTIPPT